MSLNKTRSNTSEKRTMHLFAGAGGGILADLILGHTPVVAVEWDEYCCEVLRERVNDGWFAGMRVWEGDVTLFDPSEYTGRVDCIHAGFPCTDLSVAGAGAGIGEGTRSGLYREVLRVADTVRPRELFLENVANINSAGVGTVYGDLAALGYEFRTVCLRASDVGANHHRDRWWCLARRVADTDSSWELQPKRNEQEQRGRAGYCGKEEGMADTNSNGGDRRGTFSKEARRDKSADYGENVPNTLRQRLQGQRQPEQSDYSEATINRKAVGTEHGGIADFWSVEPKLGRVANGLANRSHRIKALGNGQVPLQAAAAYKILESLFLN